MIILCPKDSDTKGSTRCWDQAVLFVAAGVEPPEGLAL